MTIQTVLMTTQTVHALLCQVCVLGLDTSHLISLHTRNRPLRSTVRSSLGTAVPAIADTPSS